MMPRSRAAALTAYLSRLADQWEEEVLRELGILVYDRSSLGPMHPYWRKRWGAIRYGGKRLGETITEKTMASRERDNLLFCAVQDFTNVYTRDALIPYGFVNDAEMGNAYYNLRWQFIVKAMERLPEFL